MSRIVNTNFGPAGTTTAAANANTKFTGVATATGAIDESNVRHEGIDRRNLDNNYIVVKTAYDDNGNQSEDFQYNKSGTHGGAFEVNHEGSPPSAGNGLEINMSSSPMVIKDGDLVRIYHSTVLSKHDGVGFGVPSALFQWFMVTFPVWDTTSGSLANFVTLPLHPTALNDPSTSQVNVDLEANKSGGIALYQPFGPDGGGGSVLSRQNGMACWHYKHSGADLTVYGIRINANGPYKYVQVGGVRGWEQPPLIDALVHLGWLKFSHGHVAVVQLRGGQP